jgi:formylglycine-generating enzyme required for sulfatase activity
VTFDEWDACISVGACSQVSDSGYGRRTMPVTNVTWDDAQRYVAWLAKMTGRPYRLLSEAEWEYAARAGTTTTYFWGNEIGTGNGNCMGCGSEWENRGPAPIGSFKPNAFGSYEMSGNVWQWLQDCFHPDYNGAPADGSAWTSGDCSLRTDRGGSWISGPQNMRLAFRGSYPAGSRNYSLGIRVGRTLTHP